MQPKSIQVLHLQSRADLILLDSSLLHITTYYKESYYYDIKDYFIFKSFTCTGLPDPICPGHFKFASRKLVGLPILMSLIDTDWLLQGQVDSEVNSNLSQVLVEY